MKNASRELAALKHRVQMWRKEQGQESVWIP